MTTSISGQEPARPVSRPTRDGLIPPERQCVVLSGESDGMQICSNNGPVPAEKMNELLNQGYVVVSFRNDTLTPSPDQNDPSESIKSQCVALFGGNDGRFTKICSNDYAPISAESVNVLLKYGYKVTKFENVSRNPSIPAPEHTAVASGGSPPTNTAGGGRTSSPPGGTGIVSGFLKGLLGK